MKRQAVTPRMKIDCLLARGVIFCTECTLPLAPGDEIEWDHVHALVHGGKHRWDNLRPLHELCHLEKTKRDIAANAKVKRILADKPSRRPMKSGKKDWPSRPFPSKRPKDAATPSPLSKRGNGYE